MVAPQLGTVSMSVSVDNGPQTNIGTNSAYPPPQAWWSIPQLRGELYGVRVTMTPDNGTPVMNRWTIKAYPGLSTPLDISAVLNFMELVEDGLGVSHQQDPYAEFDYLEGLRQSQQAITFAVGSISYPVVVNAIDWLPFKRGDNTDWEWNGDCVVYLRTLVEVS
jgi:hypothetical protein